MKKWLKLFSLILVSVLLVSQTALAAYAPEDKYFKPSDILMYYLEDMNSAEEWDVAEKTHAGYMGSAHVPVLLKDIDVAWEGGVTSNIQRAHDTGMKYIIRVSSDMGFQTDTKGMACADVFGKEITIFMGKEEPRQWISTQHPAIRARTLEIMKKLVDYGADGFAIDTHTLNYDVMEAKGGDFSEYSIINFRKYLKSKYPPQELKKKGISDINSFDYGEFIRKNYLNQYQKQKNDVPFYMDFKQFQLKSCTDFWGGLIDEIKAYGKNKGKTLCFMDNAPESNYTDNSDMIYGIPLAKKLDAYCSEYKFGYPPDDGSIAVYKLFQGIGTPLAFMANCGFSAELLSRPDATMLMKIQTAEAYANSGYRYVPFRDICLDLNNDWTTYSANMEEMYPYYDFIDTNKAYFDGTVSKATVGLFYSYEAIINEGIKGRETFTLKDFYSASKALLDAHVQYDVLFGGDDEFVKDALSYEMLKKYPVIIVPGSHYMNQKHVKLLQDYVKKGGTVLTNGSTGDASWLKIKTVSQLQSDHRITSNSQMKTSADSKVYINHCRNTKYNAEIIQVVNKDYDIKAKKNTIKKNVAFELKLDPNLAGKKLSVRYHSPDGALLSSIKYTLQNGWIRFSVPEIRTYGVATISEAGRLEAGLSLESLENRISRKEAKNKAESINFDVGEFKKKLAQAKDLMSQYRYTEAYSMSTNAAKDIEHLYDKQLADKSLGTLRAKIGFYETAGRTYCLGEAKAGLEKAKEKYDSDNFAAAHALAEDAINTLNFVIDGKLEDWKGIAPQKIELEKSSDSKGLQITEAYSYNDDEYIYFALKIKNANNSHCNFSLRCNGDKAREYHVITAYKDGSGRGSIINKSAGDDKELPVSVEVCAKDYYEMRIPIEIVGDSDYLYVDIHGLNLYYPDNWHNGDVVRYTYEMIR
jgi:hypothetical protein